MSGRLDRESRSSQLGLGAPVVVVFEDRSDVKLLRLLRPGFRHCFCVVGSGPHWIVCDPLKTRIELTALAGAGQHELADQLARPGRAVLCGRIRTVGTPRPFRLRPVTCVEIVIRILNIDAAGALTPYQLFRRLLDPVRVGHGFTAHQRHRSFSLDHVVK